MIEFYSDNNGGEPQKYSFLDEDGDEYIVQSFIPIFSTTKKNVVDLVQEFRKERTIPKWFVPIAYEAGGNMFGVSVSGEDCGCIYYWNTDYDYNNGDFEDNICFLAENFNIFFNNLS